MRRKVDRIVHLAAICWTATAMGLVMAPAALHRQAERGMTSKRLVLRSELAGLCTGTAVALFLVSVWFVYPRAVRLSPVEGGDGSAP
jgi:hypothetical protein